MHAPQGIPISACTSARALERVHFCACISVSVFKVVFIFLCARTRNGPEGQFGYVGECKQREVHVWRIAGTNVRNYRTHATNLSSKMMRGVRQRGTQHGPTMAITRMPETLPRQRQHDTTKLKTDATPITTWHQQDHGMTHSKRC